MDHNENNIAQGILATRPLTDKTTKITVTFSVMTKHEVRNGDIEDLSRMFGQELSEVEEMTKGAVFNHCVSVSQENVP